MKRAIALVAAALLAGCVSDADGPAPIDIDTDPNDPNDPPEEEEQALAPTLQAALGELGGCMSMEVWVGSGIYQLYQAETLPNNEQECGNQGNQQCQACHADATGGAAWSDDVLWSFQEHTKLPAIMRLVTGTVDDRGNFKSLVPSNRYIDKGNEPYIDPLKCHPRFVLPDDKQKAVATFVEETLDRWQNGTCDAPYIQDEQ